MLTPQELIIKSLSLEHMIPFEHAKKMWESQFKMAREEMSTAQKDKDGYYIPETFKNIKLPFFGKFATTPKKVEFINMKRKKMIENERRNKESESKD